MYLTRQFRDQFDLDIEIVIVSFYDFDIVHEIHRLFLAKYKLTDGQAD